jgi:hypothetical protein
MAATCPYVYPGGQQCTVALQGGRPYCDQCGIRVASSGFEVAISHFKPLTPIFPYPDTLDQIIARLRKGGDEVDAVNLIQFTAGGSGGIWGVHWDTHAHTCEFGYYGLNHFERVVGQRFDMERIQIEVRPTTYVYTIPSPKEDFEPCVIEIDLRRGCVELEGDEIDDEGTIPQYSIVGWFQLFGRPSSSSVP